LDRLRGRDDRFGRARGERARALAERARVRRSRGPRRAQPDPIVVDGNARIGADQQDIIVRRRNGQRFSKLRDVQIVRLELDITFENVRAAGKVHHGNPVGFTQGDVSAAFIRRDHHPLRL
jgi:hypothetical protein